MPSGESKHGNSSSSGTSTTNNNGHSNRNEKHKYCLLCDRNDFHLESIDATTIAAIQTVYKTNLSSTENRKLCRNCFWTLRILAVGNDHERFASLKELATDASYWQCVKSKYKRYVSRADTKKSKPSKSTNGAASSPSSISSVPPSPTSSIPPSSPLKPPTLPASDKIKSNTSSSTTKPDKSNDKIDDSRTKTRSNPVVDKQTITRNIRSSTKESADNNSKAVDTNTNAKQILSSHKTDRRSKATNEVAASNNKTDCDAVENQRQISTNSDKIKKSEANKHKVSTNTPKSAGIEVATAKTKPPVHAANRRQRGYAFDDALKQANDVMRNDEKNAAKSKHPSTAETIEFDGQKVAVPNGVKGTKVFRSYLKLWPFHVDTLEADIRDHKLPKAYLGELKAAAKTKKPAVSKVKAVDKTGKVQKVEKPAAVSKAEQIENVEKAAKAEKIGNVEETEIAVKSEEEENAAEVEEAVVIAKVVNVAKENKVDSKKGVKIIFELNTKVPTKIDVKPKHHRKSNKAETKLQPEVIEKDESTLDVRENVLNEISDTHEEPMTEALAVITKANTRLDVSSTEELSNMPPTLPKSILIRHGTPTSEKKRVSFVGIKDSDDEDDMLLGPLKRLHSKDKQFWNTEKYVPIKMHLTEGEEPVVDSKCDNNDEVSSAAEPIIATSLEITTQRWNDIIGADVIDLTENELDTSSTANKSPSKKQSKKQRKSRKRKKAEQFADDATLLHQIDVIPTTNLMPIENNETNKMTTRKRSKSKSNDDKPDKHTKKRKTNTAQNDDSVSKRMSFIDQMDSIQEVDVNGILESPLIVPEQYINVPGAASFEPNFDRDPLAINTADVPKPISPALNEGTSVAKNKIPLEPKVPEKRVTPLKLCIKGGKVVKNKSREKSKRSRVSTNIVNVIEAVATGAFEVVPPTKRQRKKKALPAGFVDYDDLDDIDAAMIQQIPENPNQRTPRPRSKRTESHEHDSQHIENEVLDKQRDFENNMRSKYGGHLFDAVVHIDDVQEPPEEIANDTMISTTDSPMAALCGAMIVSPTTTTDAVTMTADATTTFIENGMEFINPHGLDALSASSPCNLLIGANDVAGGDGIIQMVSKDICDGPCAIEQPANAVEAPSVSMVNVSTGTESPTATVDSTTSGYCSTQGTVTVYALGFPFNPNMTEVTSYTDQFNPTYDEPSQYYLQTDNITNCIEPLEQINQEDIISVLGRTNDTGDLNMDTAINIAAFEANSSNAGPHQPTQALLPQQQQQQQQQPSPSTSRTVYLVDYNSLNFSPSVANIGILRTKANVKQIYQPVQLTAAPQQLNIINDNYCSGLTVGSMSHELSTKLLRHDNPLLNGSNNFDETMLEIQQATIGDSMVTSSGPTPITPRRNGLNIVFTTPTKHTNGEDIQFEDLFINESQQQLLNTEDFPTTTTSDEPQFNLYSDAFT